MVEILECGGRGSKADERRSTDTIREILNYSRSFQSGREIHGLGGSIKPGMTWRQWKTTNALSFLIQEQKGIECPKQPRAVSSYGTGLTWGILLCGKTHERKKKSISS